MNLINVCQLCDKHEIRNSRMVCGMDDVGVHKHAEKKYCPIGEYQFGLGDSIAAALHRLGVQSFFRRLMLDIATCNEAWLRDGTQPSCGCEARQAALNRL